MEFCRNLSLLIANRSAGNDGNYDDFTTESNTSIYYFVITTGQLRKIKYFNVMRFDLVFSDVHLCLQFSIRLNTAPTFVEIKKRNLIMNAEL